MEREPLTNSFPVSLFTHGRQGGCHEAVKVLILLEFSPITLLPKGGKKG
jgi:hypothetical protein